MAMLVVTLIIPFVIYQRMRSKNPLSAGVFMLDDAAMDKQS
ncbi:hypothetical protein [Shewanella sp. SNU WT4]|nr:hypothetical protein [Shewanella sp. SNU WT4]